MVILGHGIYSLPEAAKLTRLKPVRVREWFNGKSNGTAGKAVFQSDYQPVGGDRAISFHDLIDLYVGGRLRDHGVSLQCLKKAHARLQRDLKTRHPFCKRGILLRLRETLVAELADRGEMEVAEGLDRQRVFSETMAAFFETIDYDEATEMAQRWRIANRVVIDPTISLGKPIVEGAGIVTAILAASYEANDHDAELVADWYKVHATHVLAAVDFERSIAA
jgi:uncharacterized protein (DUF433 family)